MAKAAKCDAAALERALQTDEIPPDTPPLLWMAIKSIKQDTADTRENLTKLELRTKALDEIHQSQDDDIQSMKAPIQVLTAQVRRSEIAQSQLQHEVEDLKARSMRDNILFNFNADVNDYRRLYLKTVCIL
jgi:vacuolar-type H+-ATPase subunit I/STV1